jgi:recombination protein RecA
MATRKERLAKRMEMAEVIGWLAEGSRRARRMSEVESFRSVPTIFTSLNRALQVGGAPLSCVWLVHGPSSGGKTALVLGVARSVHAAGGICAFIDAELSADTKRWFRLLGINTRECLYVGRTGKDEEKVPLTYEEVVEETDRLFARFQEGKKTGIITPGTPLFVIVDSVSKMVPGNLLKKLNKEGAEALGGGVGRLQALLNTAWLASLGTVVGDDDIVVALIAHEYEEAGGKGSWTAFKVRGGNALVYDSMVQLRVTFAGLVKDLSKDDAPPVGKRHKIQVLKNKHGPAFDSAAFYTASGAGICPMGFDAVREILHEGIVRGLVEGPKVEKGSVTMTSGTRFELDGRSWKLSDFYASSSVEALSVIQELESRLNSECVDSHVEAPSGEDLGDG